jgi:DNA replication protein DnaC
MTQLLNTFAGLSTARRTAINDAVLSNPERSYIFSGPGGIGKTELAKAQYRLLSSRHRYAMTAESWQEDMTAAATGRGEWPVLSSQFFRDAGPFTWHLFLDDIDKIKLTEFIEPQFKSLLDSVLRRKDQLVLTTSILTTADLYKKFGDQISSRILRRCVWVPFNETGRIVVPKPTPPTPAPVAAREGDELFV